MSSTHYTAILQMPVILHNEHSEIVEAELTFPNWYTPQPGHALMHKITDGMVPISFVCFDEDRDTIVLLTKAAAYDLTTTLEEWLQDRPDWQKAEKPLITHERRTDAPNTDCSHDPIDDE